MEEVITALEREFKRVNLDIEYVSHRLDIDTSRTRNDNIPDVCNIMKRLNELENKLITIHNKTDKITAKREDLFNEVIDILNDNHKNLTNISNSMSGFNINDNEVNFQEVKNDLSKALENSVFFDNSMIQNNNIENDENSIPINIPTTTTTVTSNTTTKSTNDKIIKNKTLLTISKERFEAVPLSLRGRCELDQVVLVLQKLQQNSSKMNKSSPVSLAELDSYGLKVTGKTGDSIISTLKALGLITKTKDGIQLVKSK